MTPTDPTPIDEPLLDALVAADEGEGASAIPTEFQDCFRLLEEVWPAHRAGVQDQPWRLARFEVLREVGRGGFGIVYQAHDPVVGRDVALKVPVPEVLVSAVPRQRFLREARAAGCLDHPNIVPVHEAGESGPLCYIISTFCDGPTLAQWLGARKEPVPVRLAAELLEALASAVQHAHDRGILHRDLKPSNVLMVDGEVPRITDFGLARLAEQDGSADLTQTGVPMGSPPYMSPEQAAGRNAEVGPASDIYGLGAILYELVAGRPPFQGQTTAETLRQVIEGDPVAPRLVRPGLPRDLETIILTCLAKEPARRYGTAALLAEDLRRFLAGEPITARPPSLGVRLRNSIARHRLLAVSGTLTSVAVGGNARHRGLVPGRQA